VLITSDCIPCNLKMILEVGRMVITDPAEVDDFVRDVLRLPFFENGDWRYTSPELAADTFGLLVERTGVADPLAAVKRRQNETAFALLPAARAVVTASDDSLREALKLSIVGNAIDVMTDARATAPDVLVARLTETPLDPEQLETLRERLAAANTVAYLTDNCGEIVFDRVLLEVITGSYDVDVTVVTHTMPILNDALLEDALAAGLDEVARVVEGGNARALPGNYVAELAPEVQAVVAAADLVISKGVANYELLSEENALAGRVTYLLHGKCRPICDEHGVPHGELVVRNL
jgi:damage-control phosphatase, subfamily I